MEKHDEVEYKAVYYEKQTIVKDGKVQTKERKDEYSDPKLDKGAKFTHDELEKAPWTTKELPDHKEKIGCDKSDKGCTKCKK